MNKKVLQNKIFLMNNTINRKKMYKSGKQWIIGSSLAIILSLTGAMGINHVQTYADTINAPAYSTARTNLNTSKTNLPTPTTKQPINSTQIQDKANILHKKIINNSNKHLISTPPINNKPSIMPKYNGGKNNNRNTTLNNIVNIPKSNITNNKIQATDRTQNINKNGLWKFARQEPVKKTINSMYGNQHLNTSTMAYGMSYTLANLIHQGIEYNYIGNSNLNRYYDEVGTYGTTNNIPFIDNGWHVNNNSDLTFTFNGSPITINLLPDKVTDHIHYTGDGANTWYNITGDDYRTGTDNTNVVINNMNGSKYGLPDHYHIINSNPYTFNFDGQDYQIPVVKDTVSDTIQYEWNGHIDDEYTRKRGKYGQQGTITQQDLNNALHDSDWEIVNNGDQNFTYNGGTHTVQIRPAGITDTILYQDGYEGKVIGTHLFQGQKIEARFITNDVLNENAPYGYNVGKEIHTIPYNGGTYYVVTEPEKFSDIVTYHDIYSDIDGKKAPTVTESGVISDTYQGEPIYGWIPVDNYGRPVNPQTFHYGSGNHTINVAPEIDGLTYKYNKNTGSLEFTGGTPQSNLSDLIDFTGTNPTSVKFDSDINMSNVSDMSNMLGEDNNLKSVDLGNNFDTSNVKNMSRMFSLDNSLHSLILPSSFNTNNVNNMSDIFSPDLKSLTIQSPNTKFKFKSELDGIGNYNMPIMYQEYAPNNISDKPHDFSTGTMGTFVQPKSYNITFNKEYNMNTTKNVAPDIPVNMNVYVPAPQGYHYVDDSNGIFQASNNNPSFDIAPNEVQLAIGDQYGNPVPFKTIDTSGCTQDNYTIKPSDLPKNYILIQGNHKVSLDNISNNGYVDISNFVNAIDTIDYVYQKSDGTTKFISSDFHPSGKLNTESSINWHDYSYNKIPTNWGIDTISNDSDNPQFTFNGGTNTIYIKPNHISDTIQYQYKGQTKGTYNFGGNNSGAKGASDTGFTIGSDPNGLPAGFHVINPKQYFYYSGGNYSVPVAPIQVTINFHDIYSDIDGLTSPSAITKTDTGSRFRRYSISSPQDWAIVNNNGQIASGTNDVNNDNAIFRYSQGNQTINVAPVNCGLVYKYNKNNKSIEFVSGTPDIILNQFSNNSIVKSARSMTFDDIDTSKVYDMNDMFHGDKHLQSITITSPKTKFIKEAIVPKVDDSYTQARLHLNSDGIENTNNINWQHVAEHAFTRKQLNHVITNTPVNQVISFSRHKLAKLLFTNSGKIYSTKCKCWIRTRRYQWLMPSHVSIYDNPILNNQRTLIRVLRKPTTVVISNVIAVHNNNGDTIWGELPNKCWVKMNYPTHLYGFYKQDSHDNFTAPTKNDFSQGNVGTFVRSKNIPSVTVNYQYNGKTLGIQKFRGHAAHYDYVNGKYLPLHMKKAHATSTKAPSDVKTLFTTDGYNILPKQYVTFNNGTYNIQIAPPSNC